MGTDALHESIIIKKCEDLCSIFPTRIKSATTRKKILRNKPSDSEFLNMSLNDHVDSQ